MKSSILTKQYGALRAEERFRLLLAAGTRGDEVEVNRLANAGQRLSYSVPDHIPYAQAFQEILFLTFIELVEDASLYLDFNAQTAHQLRASIEAKTSRKRKKPAVEQTTHEAPNEDIVEYPDWHHSGRTAYALGYLFLVKMKGWFLFCDRLHASPLALWEQMKLPGFDRLKRALALALAGAAFASVEMMRWANETRPAGALEFTEADLLTTQQYSSHLEATFRERVQWWGE